MTNKLDATTLDKVLPQTQCGLCGYGGCYPYATAIVNKEAAINLCPPGGVETLIKLGELSQQDPSPYIREMQAKQKPAMRAVIREHECIGCTKCLQACPVDAIVGANKYMHTVIADECTGCELCVTPCPVDCIDMIVIPAYNAEKKQQKSNAARNRYQARNARLAREKLIETSQHEQAKLQNSVAARKAAIAEAIARVKDKKISRSQTHSK